MDQGVDFNHRYSAKLLDQKSILPTPERPEDVHGQWKMYTREDVNALMLAAEGTPWCIAGKDMAEEYLGITSCTGEDDNYGHDISPNGKQAFYLFHLEDSENNEPSPTACASIRVDALGNVAEISGLKTGAQNQQLEDSLVPTVLEKVKTLPGGEYFLVALEHKKRLIELDNKFQAKELFSIADLRFIYELDGPIKYVDTYRRDTRPEEFRRQRNVHEQQLREVYGDEARWMVMDTRELEGKIDEILLETRFPEQLMNRCRPHFVINNISKFLAKDVKINADLLLENAMGYAKGRRIRAEYAFQSERDEVRRALLASGGSPDIVDTYLRIKR